MHIYHEVGDEGFVGGACALELAPDLVAAGGGEAEVEGDGGAALGVGFR